MAPDHRRPAADVRGRLAVGVREIPADRPVPAPEPVDGTVRFQGDILVGMGPPAAWPGYRPGLGGRVPLVPVAPADSGGLDRAAFVRRRAGRGAGRDRL